MIQKGIEGTRNHLVNTSNSFVETIVTNMMEDDCFFMNILNRRARGMRTALESSCSYLVWSTWTCTNAS